MNEPDRRTGASSPLPLAERLSPDQHAVLGLLGRGMSYDDIARLLKLERAAVRARALGAVQALVLPGTIAPDQRADIADYLFGQLPEAQMAGVRTSLADPSVQRDWAEELRDALRPWLNDALAPLPEATPVPASAAPAGRPAAGRRRASRRRVHLAFAGGVLVVVAAAAIVLLSSGAGRSGRPAAASKRAATGTASASAARELARITLVAPNPASKAAGIAEVVEKDGHKGLVIVAQNMPANSTKPKNAYAIWLYSSPSMAKLLGWVRVPVSSDGKLVTGGVVSADAARYKYLLVTLETQAHPTAPGTVVIGGHLSGI